MRKTLTIVTLLALLALLALALPARAEQPELRRAPPAGHFSSARSSFLGVELSSLDDAAAAEAGVSGSGGARIDRVLEDTAASESGLEAGDVVLAFDGERVRGAAHLGRLVRETALGRTVDIVVLRDGHELTIETKLRERAAGPSFLAPLPPLPALPAMPAMPRFAPQDLRDAMRWAGGATWRLGIGGSDLGDQLAAFFEVDQGDGVLVEKVVPGSAAEKAGLRAGDVIVGLDEERIHALADLRTLLADGDRDAAATLVIVRKGRERSLPAELERVERSGALWRVMDESAVREFAERHAREAERWAEQAERWRAEEGDLLEELEAKARELERDDRLQERELQRLHRQLEREQRDAERALRSASPAPTAAPPLTPQSIGPAGLPL